MASPMEQERFRAAKQKGMSEEAALKHSLSATKSPGLNVHGSGDKAGKAGATANAGASPKVLPPKGHRLSSMEIRPAHSGVIVRHSFERIPSAGKPGPQENDLITNSPQEHAFSSTQEAQDHIAQHLGSLLDRDHDGQ